MAPLPLAAPAQVGSTADEWRQLAEAAAQLGEEGSELAGAMARVPAALLMEYVPGQALARAAGAFQVGAAGGLRCRGGAVARPSGVGARCAGAPVQRVPVRAEAGAGGAAADGSTSTSTSRSRPSARPRPLCPSALAAAAPLPPARRARAPRAPRAT
jgi:hypothetical protein